MSHGLLPPAVPAGAAARLERVRERGVLEPQREAEQLRRCLPEGVAVVAHAERDRRLLHLPQLPLREQLREQLLLGVVRQRAALLGLGRAAVAEEVRQCLETER